MLGLVTLLRDFSMQVRHCRDGPFRHGLTRSLIGQKVTSTDIEKAVSGHGSVHPGAPTLRLAFSGPAPQRKRARHPH